MKYTFETDDPAEARMIMNVHEICGAIQEYDNKLRDIIKHGDDQTASEWAYVHRSMMWKILDEYQITHVI